MKSHGQFIKPEQLNVVTVLIALIAIALTVQSVMDGRIPKNMNYFSPVAFMV